MKIFWVGVKIDEENLIGISRETFKLHLKEYEFRFNHKNDNLYDIILKILKK